MDLISTLTSQLGINDSQARGGAGLLLKMAREKLGGEFSAIDAALPEANGLIEQAPESGGGALGAIGGLLGKFGGSAGQMGALAELAGGFSKLGLDKSLVSKFIPVVLEYLQKQDGGDRLKELLGKVVH